MNNEFTGTWRGRRPSVGGLLAANNLSDLQNTENARENLGAASKDDLEVLKTQTDSELFALHSRKANIGEHLFSTGGYVRRANVIQTFPLSICFTTKYLSSETPSAYNPQIFNIGGLSGYNQSTGFVLSAPYISSRDLHVRGRFVAGGTLYTSGLSNFFDGKEKVCVFIATLTGFKLYINGVLEATSEWEAFDFSSPVSITIGGEADNTNYEQIISRVSVFNFDMSAEDAPYTVADYAAGKQPSLLLKQGIIATTDPTMGASTETGWDIITAPSSTVTNGDWKAGQYVKYLKNRTDDLPEGVSYAVDIACSDYIGGRAVSTLFYNYAVSIADFQGKTNWFRISGWVRKNTTSSGTGAMDSIIVGTQYDTILQLPAADFEQGVWTKIDKIVSFTEDRSWGGANTVIGLSACGQSYTDYAWSLADFKVEVLGEVLELADFSSAYQIKDLSGNGNHATIFGEVLSRKNENPATMQVAYSWGSGVSTGAYIMGDTVTLPANAEIEVLAKASASATLSLGTSSSATTTFANAASVGTATASIAKFYTSDSAQKLFATPSVAGLTINLTLKITSLK